VRVPGISATLFGTIAATNGNYLEQLRPYYLSLPDGTDTLALANNIGEFFVKKVKEIQSKLDTSTSSSSIADATMISRRVDVSLTEFSTLSVDDVRKLISRSAKKSSSLDPKPTSLVVQWLDELLHVITAIINMSLMSGHFAAKWKEVIVTPLLKKPGTELLLKNLRPVSNLAFISKLTETAVAVQLQSHMSCHGLYPVLQSAYRCHYSTETALLKIRNDILLNMNKHKQHVTLLVLLDLSASFDTANREILLESMTPTLRGALLSWFRSFLSRRSQRVAGDHKLSKSLPLDCGVPQGSCLGPLLFNIYCSSLIETVEAHLPEVHSNADDS